MSNFPEGNDPILWHRYFAIETNNQCWPLVEKDRSPEEHTTMLKLASASYYHWHEVGIELNSMRATTLMAIVCAQLGLGEQAFVMADEVKKYFLENKTDDWEIALTHTAHAHAAFASGKDDIYRASYAEALLALDAITDTVDREIVMATFVKVPSPL